MGRPSIPTATRRRLVIVGIGNDEASAAAVIAAVRWMKTAAPAAIKRDWIVSALPVSPPTGELTESQATQRWLAFQAPDLVVRVAPEVVQPGSAGLDNVEWATVPVTGTIAALQELLTKPRGRSPAHETLARADPPRAARRCPPARDPLSGNAEHQLHPVRLVGEHAAARRHQRRRVAAAEGARSSATVVVRRTEDVRGQNPADRGGGRDGVRGPVKDGRRQRGCGGACE